MTCFGFLANKIVLADDTELENVYVDIVNGFARVYDAPGKNHHVYYSSSMIKTIDAGYDPEEDPDTDPDADPDAEPDAEEITEG